MKHPETLLPAGTVIVDVHPKPLGTLNRQASYRVHGMYLEEGMLRQFSHLVDVDSASDLHSNLSRLLVRSGCEVFAVSLLEERQDGYGMLSLAGCGLEGIRSTLAGGLERIGGGSFTEDSERQPLGT